MDLSGLLECEDSYDPVKVPLVSLSHRSQNPDPNTESISKETSSKLLQVRQTFEEKKVRKSKKRHDSQGSEGTATLHQDEDMMNTQISVITQPAPLETKDPLSPHNVKVTTVKKLSSSKPMTHVVDSTEDVPSDLPNKLSFDGKRVNLIVKGMSYKQEQEQNRKPVIKIKKVPMKTNDYQSTFCDERRSNHILSHRRTHRINGERSWFGSNRSR